MQDPHDRERGDGFARAALAHDSDHLALRDREADTIERLHDSFTGAELDREVLDSEEGRLGHVRRRGSIRSRRPSPRRLKQKTAVMRASPGKRAIHHSPDTMNAAPSATMMPHSGVGGRTPRPMNERPAA